MRSGDGFIPAFNVQMITDMNWGIIAHSEVLTEPGDRGLTEKMINNLEAETSIVPEELFADAAYYSIDQLHWLEVDRGITSWISVPDQSRAKKDSKAGIDLEYHLASDSWQCSEGKSLHRKQIANQIKKYNWIAP